MHQSVLLEEVLALLDPLPGQVVVDATLGNGGHALEILKRIGPQGRLIGIDQDPEAIKRAKENLKSFSRVDYIHENFSRLDQILISLNLRHVDAVLLDIGISSEQLEVASRGFSFMKEGPLDMRMNPSGPITAKDLVNDLSQEELENLFWKYGEERWGRRIAYAICEERLKSPIETTDALVRIIQKAVPKRFHFKGKHPATRVFQALRIKVNEELESLDQALSKVPALLSKGGRFAVISFHSLEDRKVKQTFRAWADKKEMKLLTKKAVKPTEVEIEKNPRSRSARLRVVEKI